MHMVHKIMHVKACWCLEPGLSKRAMPRSGEDPLKIKARTERLEMRKQFFSLRVISDWKNLPDDMEC